MAVDTTYDYYEVAGADLAAVSTDIFKVADGKGRLSSDRTKRFAGHTLFEFEVPFGWRFIRASSTIRMQVTDITWTTKIRLPKWRLVQMNGAPLAMRLEFRRFVAALNVHELGHVHLYDVGMERVKDALANKPAGLITLNVTKEPEFNPDKTPKTAADRAICVQMETASKRLVEQNALFVAMKAKQDRYDAAPPGPALPAGATVVDVFQVDKAAEQPRATDHGKSQNATLNTAP